MCCFIDNFFQQMFVVFFIYGIKYVTNQMYILNRPGSFYSLDLLISKTYGQTVILGKQAPTL